MLNVGGLLRLPRGRQPASLVLPRRRARGARRDHRRLHRLDPGRRRLLRRATARRSKRSGSLATTRSEARSAPAYAGVPVGYSESIFQGLGEDLGLRLLTPPQLRQGDRRGNRRDRRRQADRRRPGAIGARSRSGSTTPERDARRAAGQRRSCAKRASRSSRSPRRSRLRPRASSNGRWQSSKRCSARCTRRPDASRTNCWAVCGAPIGA